MVRCRIFRYSKQKIGGISTANHVFIAVSLDGFIADAQGRVDWLNDIPNPEGPDYGYTPCIEKIDAIVMGRLTFETVMSFGAWSYTKPVIVLSKTLKELPQGLSGKVSLSSDEIEPLLVKLHDKGYLNLYIDGGRVIQSFLQRDLIDEMCITHIPILLGGGIPLFGSLEKPMKFEHATTKILGQGLVSSTIAGFSLFSKQERSF